MYFFFSKPPSKAFARKSTRSYTACCKFCKQTDGCVAFTYEAQGPGGAHCFLKNTTDGAHSQAGAVSGSFEPPPPPTPTAARVAVLPTIVNVVDEGFKTWNIDASPNREWDTRDLSQPLLYASCIHFVFLFYL